MNTNVRKLLFGDGRNKHPPVLLAVTPPRTGERTLLGVENLLQSIAVPEPFSLELAGDVDGVALLARCHDDQVVRRQLSAHYPRAHFLRVAANEMKRAGVRVPLWVSHRNALERSGPLGAAWQAPDRWEPSCPFPATPPAEKRRTP